MASGTIYGSTGNEYIDARIDWSSVADYDNNCSSVTASLYYKRNNTGHTTYGTGSFYITIDGVLNGGMKTMTITEDFWLLAYKVTNTVYHNTDGTKSITISATGSIPGTTLTSTNVSGTVKLDSIPRASTLNHFSGGDYFDDDMVYGYTPKSTAVYTRCNIALNVGGTFTAIKTINLGKASAESLGKTINMDVDGLSNSELSTIYNKLPNTDKGVLRLTLRTYSDSSYSTQVGDAPYKEITLKIPNTTDTQPTATFTLSPVNSLSSPFNALYIKGKTKVKAEMTNGAGKYGASIVSYKTTILGKSGGASYTSEYLTTDTVTVKGTVTDSRGFSRTYTKDVPVIPYTNPRVIPISGQSEIICARCDASGNLSESGTYLKIKAKRTYSKVESSGAQKNFCSIRYRYKAEGGSYSSWTTILATNSTSDEVDTGALLGGTLLLTSSYMVQVGVIDTVGESENITLRISTDAVYMHRAGSLNSLGIGKYAEEENVVDIAESITAKFRGEVQFLGESWLSRALGTNVIESSVNSGRWGGTGVYYRVCAGGKHIYVAFNVSFTTSSSTVRAESQTIPIPPKYDVYALCPVGFSDGSRGIATVSVSPKGRVNIYAVHKLPGATLSTGDTVNWIDGYIDYWT